MTMTLKNDAMLGGFSVMAYNPQGLQSDGVPMPEGWEQIGKEIIGSFAGFAYINKMTNEVVIAFRGSNDRGDWTGANIDILCDKWTEQMSEAVEFAAKVRESAEVASLHGAKIYVTGHSLGGAEAQIVSQMFGFDGMTLDPLAASRLVDTPEFQEYSLRLTQTEHGLGMPASFINYGVTESFVSHNTGQHLGPRRPIPGMDLPGKELGKAALVAATTNPALGFVALMASDQIGSKHSSIPGSQTVRMLAEAEKQDTANGSHLFAGKVSYEEVVIRKPGPLNQDVVEKQPNTVLMKGEDGEPRALLKFRGLVQDRVLEIYTPDGKQQLYRVTDPHADVASPAPTKADVSTAGQLTEAQRAIVMARIQENLNHHASLGERFSLNISLDTQADTDAPAIRA